MSLIKEAEKAQAPSDVQAAMLALGYKAQQKTHEVLKGKVKALQFTRQEQVEDKVVEVEFIYNPTSESWSLLAGPKDRVNKLELSSGYGADDLLKRAARQSHVKPEKLPFIGFPSEAK